MILVEEDNSTYRAIAYVHCDIGYFLSTTYLTCMLNGKWENATCEIRDCGLPPTLTDGSLNISGSIKHNIRSPCRSELYSRL
ncbi:hypothetical protein DPMN_137329 [Dreissena polymorpha]|uniref:Sushi domain-containing protein n=1 Tax=Dreissena polymorpha TaxID=45954 RepID=A0A9D4G7L3_DREPO|nr:hypothetical protein DPMN_137329 [Dreissena polymorpha]